MEAVESAVEVQAPNGEGLFETTATGSKRTATAIDRLARKAAPSFRLPMWPRRVEMRFGGAETPARPCLPPAIPALRDGVVNRNYGKSHGAVSVVAAKALAAKVAGAAQLRLRLRMTPYLESHSAPIPCRPLPCYTAVPS